MNAPTDAVFDNPENSKSPSEIDSDTEAELAAWELLRDTRAELDGFIRALLAVLEPVIDWYQSDKLPERHALDIIRYIVDDLQFYRRAALAASPSSSGRELSHGDQDRCHHSLGGGLSGNSLHNAQAHGRRHSKPELA